MLANFISSSALAVCLLCGPALAQGPVVNLALHPDPVFRPTPGPLNGKILGLDATAATYVLSKGADATQGGFGASFWHGLTVTVIRTSTVRYRQDLTTTSTNVISPGWTVYAISTLWADASCTGTVCTGSNGVRQTQISISGGQTFTVPNFPVAQPFMSSMQPTNVPVTITAIKGSEAGRRDVQGRDGVNVVAPRVTASPWIA
ncbi:hypothetical protein GGTG_07469 [Gaeumannomyces tritici R3-111a-1]|uniref:Uncharacterized protein n=1 Tax=Gaeumannomyces tritici (strain R3-111a-1) TaxID=644352 RepID=J3P1S1_GAET3|nr:hypothetical protein GGTG_07469 [Gaeumannomyces tritici R3-111a-1]EJT73613.1 hypothetical protein GGTG_07469 [Gaeumannomyces tritici R3-111a-1]